MNKLDKIMNAKTVAIIGASPKIGSVGNELLKRVLEFGYKGKVYGVHPSETNIMGVATYPHIYDIPDKIDMAVIAIPAKFVSSVVDECNQANVKNIIVVSSGFKETGVEGQALEQELLDKVRAYNMNMLGPNCLGIINSEDNISLDACFAPLQPVRGHIGFATQSGALASGIINILPDLRIGLGQVISLGNQADINALDVLEHWEQDANISQILLYLESIQEPKQFREVASRISKKKPILAIKSGRSSAGAKATASHTGSLAGDDTTAEGLLSSCGIIREYYLRDLFNTAQVFDKCPLPKGKNLAILTNAGGPGILATDTAGDLGLDLAQLSETTKDKLRAVLPPQASVHNPVDMIASAPSEHYAKCADILLNSKEVDMLLVIYLYITGKNDLQVLANLEELKAKYPNKPIVSVYMTTPDFDERIRESLPNSSVPIFSFMVDAVRGLRKLYDRKVYLDNAKNVTHIYPVQKEVAQKTFNEAKNQGITTLSVAQSLNVFTSYGLPTPKWGIATTLAEAKRIASSCGYPVVIKISSTKITHKTDIGGVIVNIKTEEELAFHWDKLITKLNKANLIDQIEGIVVMQQVKGSNRELVAGVIEKGENGYQMMFGMGGIFIEALKEVAFRPCPLTINDANALIESTKAKNIIGDLRGNKGVDKTKVAETLLRLSQLVTDFPIISELDANPLMIDAEGNLFAVDARIVIKNN